MTKVLRVFLVWLSLSVVAQAQPSEAERRFVSGTKHFDLAEYEAALADFKEGYRISNDPVFLYNTAQCYRQMHDNANALRYYRVYLSRSPNASNRAEVEQKIERLQRVI